MDKEHHFKIEEAKKYGIEKAIILYNIRFWLDKNRANKKNIFNKDGKDYFWTYNSSAAYGELFPYMAESSIRRYLVELETEDGVLISGNFNKMGYDRTKWYTTIEHSIDQNEQSIAQNEQPIPYNNTDNKTDVKSSPTLIEKSKEDMKLTTRTEKEKLIGGIYAQWIKMASTILDIDEKDVDRSTLMRVISSAVKREETWTIEDFKSLFKYFFNDEKMAFEKKLSYALCLSATYISQYKLSKKGKKKSVGSFADVSDGIRL